MLMNHYIVEDDGTQTLANFKGVAELQLFDLCFRQKGGGDGLELFLFVERRWYPKNGQMILEFQ